MSDYEAMEFQAKAVQIQRGLEPAETIAQLVDAIRQDTAGIGACLSSIQFIVAAHGEVPRSVLDWLDRLSKHVERLEGKCALALKTRSLSADTTPPTREELAAYADRPYPRMTTDSLHGSHPLYRRADTTPEDEEAPCEICDDTGCPCQRWRDWQTMRDCECGCLGCGRSAGQGEEAPVPGAPDGCTCPDQDTRRGDCPMHGFTPWNRPARLEACDCGRAQDNHGWACRCSNPPSRRSAGVETHTGTDDETCSECGYTASEGHSDICVTGVEAESAEIRADAEAIRAALVPVASFSRRREDADAALARLLVRLGAPKGEQ